MSDDPPRAETPPSASVRAEDLLMFKDIVEHLKTGVALWQFTDVNDPSSLVVVYQNPAASEVARTKVSREAFIGKRLVDVLPAMEKSGLLEQYASISKTGKETFLPDVIYPGDEILPETIFRVYVYPFPDNRLLIEFENITTEKKLQAAVKDRTEELERLNKMMTGRELRMAELKAENAELRKAIETAKK